MIKRYVLSGVAFGALIISGAAQAQTQPPPPPATDTAPVVADIIVTAQKRSENLQDVPIAITAITGQSLRDGRIDDLVALSGHAPGLQIKSDDNAANPRIFIRGVGVNDFNPSTASAVGIYVDGAYVASPLAQLAAFYDLDQVEILRGPQGTLYGRNTTGGAINLTTRKPSNTFEADASAEYGRFNSVDLQGGVGGPIVDGKLAFRIAGLYARDDGYSLNRLTGHRGNNTDRWALRGTLRFTPNSRLTDDLTVSVNKSRGGSIWAYNRSLLPATAQATGPDGLCAPGYYTSGQCTNILGYANTSKNLYEGDYSFEGQDRLDLFSATNTATFDLGGVSLVSVTSYQHADRNDQEDTDASPLIDIGTGPAPVITASYIARQNTFSQELRLQSNGHTALRYVAGLYYAHDDLSNNSHYNVLPGLLDPDPLINLANGIGLFGWPLQQKTDSYAAFAQLDYDITDQLTLTGGLRYSADHKSFHYFSNAANGAIPIFTYDGAKTFSSVSGRVGVQYKASRDVNLYASYNRGTKSGGFFSGQTGDPADIGPYADETVNAYEIGAKTELFGRRVRANFSAFYYDYKNLQVYTTIVRGTITEQLFTNASAARLYGGEAEIEATPFHGLDLSVGVSLLSAEYRNFKSDLANADYSGNRLPSAPTFSLNASANYVHDLPFGAIVASLDLTHRSKVFFDTANTARLTDPARTFVDGRLGLRLGHGRYEIGVWGKNLFDETNIVDITSIESLGFDVFSVGPPRTYGLYLRAKY
ncbi:MAG TPA: TonB-dependent receptor [Sphingomonas sp.]|nr:TonB-dependent receptor [Sphingomonas sp.]